MKGKADRGRGWDTMLSGGGAGCNCRQVGGGNGQMVGQHFN